MKFPLPAIFCFIFLVSCSSNETQTAPENDIDAARNFIDLALKGKYDKARSFLYKDPQNEEMLDNIERYYQTKMSTEDKVGYMSSDIIFYDTRRPNDSVSVVSYDNTFKKKKDSLRLVKVNGQWLIDLKYSFLHSDTLQQNIRILPDSLNN